MIIFCNVEISFKYRDTALIYTDLKLCTISFGTPGIIEKQKSQKSGLIWMSENYWEMKIISRF